MLRKRCERVIISQFPIEACELFFPVLRKNGLIPLLSCYDVQFPGGLSEALGILANLETAVDRSFEAL